ncbi:MAG TPA: type VI secretion system protein TssA [Bryobacteraceae bacterium]|nr:type VI secretion system protein TssA [Bryobacteraceae bacterium]
MPLRDDLLNPVPGENPSGANLRYDPAYDKIKEARREDDDAPQGDWQRERKVADFKTVVKLASELLATRTKDLQLAAWLTEAMLRQESFAGLLQGLNLLRGLIENFWDTLYPEVEDGDLELRAAPVEWVGTRLDAALREAPITRGGLGYYKYKESRAVGYEQDAAENEQKQNARAAAIAEGKVTAEDFDKDAASTSTAQYEAWVGALDGCQESLEALGALCEEKFGNYTPSFSPLRAAIEEVRHTANQILQKRPDRGGATAEAEEQPEPEAEVSGEPVSGDASAAAAAPARKKKAVAGIDPEDLDDAAARLDAVARFLRQQDPYSPGPYLLLRGYRWGELRGYGESPDPTALLPPSSEVRQNVKRLALESNWAELLEFAETAMAQPCGRAWLDLQRYVVRAAEEYGYRAIAAAIRSELRALIADLPQLPTWTLMDDTPTANAETQSWLKEIAAPSSAQSMEESAPMLDEAPAETSAPEGEPAPPDTYTLALEAARSGRAPDAIQMLADEIPLQRSGRARFQRRLQLAQICMMTGNETLAQPILQDLAETIENHKLEGWEAADAVAHPLALLYRCISKLDGGAEIRQKLYARISRLDPVRALECGR